MHSRHLVVKQHKNEAYGVHYNSFFCRAPKLWNLLPENVVSAPSLDCFKRRLDKHWKDADFRFCYLRLPPELSDIHETIDELLELS